MRHQSRELFVHHGRIDRGTTLYLGSDLRNRAGGQLHRLLELNRHLLLEVADGGEVFIEPRLVGGRHLFHQRIALVGDAGQDAFPQHHQRIGLELRSVRVLEIGTEQALVKSRWRDLRRIEAIGAARTPACIAPTVEAHFDGTKAHRTFADVIADSDIEARGVVAAVLGHDARHLALGPRIVILVGLTIEERLHAAVEVHLGLDRLEAGEVRRQLVGVAGLLRNPLTHRQAERPEPRAEARRQCLAGGGIGVAISVQKRIEDRNADGDCSPVEHPAKHGTPTDFAARLHLHFISRRTVGSSRSGASGRAT